MHTPTHAAWPHSAPTPSPGSGFPGRDSRGSPFSCLQSSAPPRSRQPSGPPHRTPTLPAATAAPEDPPKPPPHSDCVPAPTAQSHFLEAQTKPEAPSQSAPKPQSPIPVPSQASRSKCSAGRPPPACPSPDNSNNGPKKRRPRYSTSPRAFVGALGNGVD